MFVWVKTNGNKRKKKFCFLALAYP
uniref:Uncharacterized protein n=1 Tax=Arundo donax TaxID=35708 RepID=A0A0A9TQ36_ARUDO